MPIALVLAIAAAVFLVLGYILTLLGSFKYVRTGWRRWIRKIPEDGPATKSDVARILDEIARGTAAPGMSPPDTADLAAQATKESAKKLEEALDLYSAGEYREAIEHIFSAYDRELPPRAREQLYLLAGSAYLGLSDYKVAEEHFNRVLTIARGVPDRAAEAAALTNLGVTYRFLGDLEGAEACHSEALEIDRNLDSKDVATDLGNLGIVYMERGDFDPAAIHFTESLEGHRRSGDLHGQASQLGNLGLLAKHRRDLEGAADY